MCQVAEHLCNLLKLQPYFPHICCIFQPGAEPANRSGTLTTKVNNTLIYEALLPLSTSIFLDWFGNDYAIPCKTLTNWMVPRLWPRPCWRLTLRCWRPSSRKAWPTCRHRTSSTPTARCRLQYRPGSRPLYIHIQNLSLIWMGLVLCLVCSKKKCWHKQSFGMVVLFFSMPYAMFA